MFYVPAPIWFAVAWLFLGYLGAAIIKYDSVKIYPEWRGPDITFSLLIIPYGLITLFVASVSCLVSHKKLGMNPNIFKRITKQ